MKCLSKSTVRLALILVCFVMFCIQFETAIKNLINPPKVDSTYITELENIDLPLITVCPTNQTNITALEELGYFYQKFILAGWKTDEKITSWGEQQNLTIREFFKQLTGITDYTLDLTLDFSEINFHSYLLFNQILDYSG